MGKRNVGARVWVIPDGYLPAESTGGLKSHESTCVLNLGTRPATIRLTAYFEDREPLKGLQVTCPARRTVHIRLDALKNPQGQSIPPGTPFALKAYAPGFDSTGAGLDDHDGVSDRVGEGPSAGATAPAGPWGFVINFRG
jgi:hypothetical protein